jgi:hypothetical protein
MLEGALRFVPDHEQLFELKVGEITFNPAKHIHQAKNESSSASAKVLNCMIAEKGQPLAISAQWDFTGLVNWGRAPRVYCCYRLLMPGSGPMLPTLGGRACLPFRLQDITRTAYRSCCVQVWQSASALAVTRSVRRSKSQVRKDRVLVAV